jgi:SH3-like domain-containing protein
MGSLGAMGILASLAWAEEAKLALPRFASLDSREVNMRSGPGKDYPILWVYQRKALPVEIIQEFENWRRIRDRDGTLGWVQQNLLSGRRTAQIVGETRVLRAAPQQDARPTAKLEAGVIARILECRADSWCRLEAAGVKGWITRDGLWGVYVGEVIEAD